MIIRVLAVFLLLGISAVPVMAEDESPAQKQAKQMFEAVKAFADGLDDRSAQHFYIIYHNYNLTEAVHIVREDVSNAIDACGEENTDMKEELDGRFGEWDKALQPALEEAEANTKNMVIAQEYASKKEFDDLFKIIDKTREETNKSVNKVPVTRRDACEHLLDTMDDTEDELLELLRETLTTKVLPPETPVKEEPAEEKSEE